MNVSVQRYRSTDRFRKSLSKRVISSRTIIPALFIAAVILFACMHIWQRVHVLGLAKEIGALEKEKVALTDLFRKSEADIVNLQRRDIIEKRVSKALKMKRTSPNDQYALTPAKPPEPKRDGLDKIKGSIDNFFSHLLVLNESKADTINVFENDDRRR